MNILGIETSCDETAVSVVVNGQNILSNVIASSLKEHKKYGGIIPEIASRRQLELIGVVTQKALEDAKLELKNIDGIAVTQSPGLIGSLLVGICYAKALSYCLNKPLIEVDHIKAHLYANFLTYKNSKEKHFPSLPAIGLVVSGGHTSLFKISNFKNFQLLGQTKDDAAGEAFDKVARILGLGYPGGPIIDRLAKAGKNKEIQFSCAQLENSFDFSFSGVKTAVLYYKQKNQHRNDFSINKIAYAFEDSVVSTLVKKSLLTCKIKKIKTLLVGGGVAANSQLRNRLQKEAQKNNIKIHFPPMSLCIDNAAMIAGLGYHLLKGKEPK